MIKKIKYNRSVGRFKSFLNSCKLTESNGGLCYSLKHFFSIKNKSYGIMIYYYDGSDIGGDEFNNKLLILYNDFTLNWNNLGVDFRYGLDKNTIAELVCDHYIENTIHDTLELKTYFYTMGDYEIYKYDKGN